MKYQRKPENVEASQVTQDLTLTDGTVIPAGHWLCIHDGGKVTAVNDADFQAEFEPYVDPAPTEEPAPDAGQPQPTTDPNPGN